MTAEPTPRYQWYSTSVSEAYAQTLTEMQQLCQDLGLSFRSEMMALAEAWIEKHTPGSQDTHGMDTNDARQEEPNPTD